MPTRCSRCTGQYRMVLGDGPTSCRVMCIGEKPGENEDRRGRVFVGPAGMEYDHYLSLAGLHRDEVYTTNAVKCRTGGNNNKPSDRDVSVCAGYHIPNELEMVHPTIVILMGATACSLAVQDIDLETQHGIPFRGDLWAWNGWIVPMYHPAAGLHDTSTMIPLLEDWERLGGWLSHKWIPPTDEHYRTNYRLVEYHLPYYDRMYSQVAVDTETQDGKPWSLQFSLVPGTGWMIRENNREGIDWFREFVKKRRVILHNAGQDLDTLHRMDINIPDGQYRDTMQEAYHLCNQPQGLKALGYRLCGVKMQSYADLVTPHSRRVMANWLYKAWTYAANNWQWVEQKQLKTKTKQIMKISEIEKALARIHDHTINSEGYDPWKRVEELFDDWKYTGMWDQTLLLAECGWWPKPGIAHVPLNEAVEYGCRDADITLRVAMKLEELRGSGKYLIQGEDADD
jgi:uracil-DNA glycosylase family 4